MNIVSNASLHVGRLFQMGNPQVTKHIADLKDASPDIRRRAAHMLGEIGDTSAIPELIEALKDQDRLVRWRAVDALGEIGEVSPIPSLSRRPHFVRRLGLRVPHGHLAQSVLQRRALARRGTKRNLRTNYVRLLSGSSG